MLRIFWILPGGCTLLAIIILALSFGTLDRPHSQSIPNVAQTRFAVTELGEHPEWRQFLILSADRRANELNTLREMLDIRGANDVASDTPMVAAQPAVDTGASTPVQAPIPAPDENHPIGIQEETVSVPILPEDTPTSVDEEKPTVNAREEKSIAADQRDNELNRLGEILDIKGAVASDTLIIAAQPANRSNSDRDESNVLSTQSPAADTGASTTVQVPIATPDENHPTGIQENKLAVPALLENTRASGEEEKPAASALEENPIALGEEKSTKATTDTPIVAGQPANRNSADLDENNALSTQSPAADTGASAPAQVPIATADENHATDIQEDKLAVSTLPADTRASVQEEKPTVSALEDKRVAIGSEKSTKVTTGKTKVNPGKKSAAIKTPQQVKPRAQSPAKAVQNARSRARAPLKQKPSSPQYFFDPFGYPQSSQTSMVNATNQQPRQISTPDANNYSGNQRAGHP